MQRKLSQTLGTVTPPNLPTVQSGFFRGATAQQLQSIKDQLVHDAHRQDAQKLLGHGLAIGAGMSGLGLLLKSLSRRVKPPASHYTVPITTAVYTREEEEAAKKKRAFFPKLPSESLPSPLRDLVSKDKYRLAYALTALGIGIPTGLYAGRQLGNLAANTSRNRDLYVAQRDYEQALRDYSGTEEVSEIKAAVRKRKPMAVGPSVLGGPASRQPKVLKETKSKPKSEQKLIGKAAGLDQVDIRIRRLAENMQKIAKSPRLTDRLVQYAVAYGVLAPLVAGAMGFKNQWADRDYKSLNLADITSQIDREVKNPTFTLMNLDQLPAKKNKEPEQEPEDRFDVNTLDTQYL